MMQVRVNGEVRELSLIDPDSGVDFERDGPCSDGDMGVG